MRIYQLEGFYYVAKHHGYTAAAEAMPYPIGQPAVFQQVKTLEEDLGVKLVSKPPKGKLQLTPEGRALFEFIAPFFERLPALERTLQQGRHGTVIIGALPLFLKEVLPDRLSRFHRRHPDMKLHLIEEHDPARLERRLLDGEVDLAIGHFPTLPPWLPKSVIGHLEAVAAFPTGHALAKRASVALKELAAFPFIAYPAGHLVRTTIDHAFGKLDLAPNVVMEGPSSETILDYVSRGFGVTIVPQLSGTGKNRSRIGLKRLALPGIFEPRPIHLVMRPTGYATPAFNDLLAQLKGAAK